jgi:hypothetical protein
MPHRLNPGEMLLPNQSLNSQDGRMLFIMQQDGNLVLYRYGLRAIWATNTWGTPVSQAVMQTDGNLVLYGPSGAVWSSGTWNNPGAFLLVQDDENVVIYASDGRPLWASNTWRPAGVTPLQTAVPAFWSLESQYQPHWNALKQAGAAVGITVIDGSWPATAKAPPTPTWKQEAQDCLNALPGMVLGYVSTRVSETGPLRANADILNGTQKPDGTVDTVGVKDWYDEFGGQIDGIYFDELVIPPDPASAPQAQSLIAQFRNIHPSPAKLMILAGQCPDDWVIGSQIDWALLWESHRDPSYSRQFYGARLEGGDPYKPQYIPRWWKDPANRSKIVHVVHDCNEPDRQHTLGLALERNAGYVFVMDRRGLNNNNQDALYNHLPPYWHLEVRELASYDDFGVAPLQALRAAYRYGVSQGKVYAWPNFEGAWYSGQHVRGTYLLDPGPHVTQRTVPLADLPKTYFSHPSSPPETASVFDIARLWEAVHKYARAQGYETALPTFDLIATGGGPALNVFLLATGLPWLQSRTVQVSNTYQQPTFAEPGAVIRNVNRVITNNGDRAGFPTFVPDTMNATGRATLYNCYALTNAAPITWQDVPTSVYLQQI